MVVPKSKRTQSRSFAPRPFRYKVSGIGLTTRRARAKSMRYGAHFLPEAPSQGEYRMKTEPLKTAMTKIFDLNLPYFHRVTKNHRRFLQSPVPLFLQVGNIRSRINPPNASCWPASDCGPEGQSPPADEGPSDRSDEEFPGAVRESNPGSGLATPIRQLSVRT